MIRLFKVLLLILILTIHNVNCMMLVKPNIKAQQPMVNPLASSNNNNNQSYDKNSKDEISIQKKDTKSMDSMIVQTALPAMMNLAIVPIVTSIETMWIGRMGNALALAGQSAASTAFLTCFYLLSFLPTMLSPMVASLSGAGKHDEVKAKVSETLSLCNIMGFVGMLVLTLKPMWMLQLVLASDAPALEVAIPYLRLRALSLIPSIITATSFAAFRGTLDTKTPLYVCIASSAIKLVLDPFFIFHSGLGAAGATISTLISETVASVINFYLLWKRDLIDINLVTKIPTKKSLLPMLAGGGIMMVRQIAINVCTLASSRASQSIDSTGVSAAAFGILMQIYTIGFVVHVAMQGAAAAIIPTELAKSGVKKARTVANRLFSWSVVTGCALGIIQVSVLPFVLKLFTPLEEIQKAIVAPAVVASILHAVNGPRFVGEGEMMGLSSFRDLTLITLGGMAILLGALRTSLGNSVQGIMIAQLMFCSYQTITLVLHYLFVGKLKFPFSREKLN